MKTLFAKILYQWHSTIERDLPWKVDKDPYKVWLSEIILQQTRVEQGKPYYIKFINKWPTLLELAQASEDEVLSLWQGLGYYSRGRNLLNTAKELVLKHNGVFPKNKSDLMKFKGIGDYTAAAILSFTFDLPYPVIDGNVKRIISRYFGVNVPIDTREGSKLLEKYLNSIFDAKNPSEFNQAMIDFGALQCTPKPKCYQCPMVSNCQAYADETYTLLPLKSKKMVKKIRYLHFIFIHDRSKMIIHQRTEKDIWQGLFQFPLIESESFSMEDLQNFLKKEFSYIRANLQDKKVTGTHQLTHQTIVYSIYFVEAISLKKIEEPYLLIPIQARDNYGFPQIIKNFLVKL